MPLPNKTMLEEGEKVSVVVTNNEVCLSWLDAEKQMEEKKIIDSKVAVDRKIDHILQNLATQLDVIAGMRRDLDHLIEVSKSEVSRLNDLEKQISFVILKKEGDSN